MKSYTIFHAIKHHLLLGFSAWQASESLGLVGPTLKVSDVVDLGWDLRVAFKLLRSLQAKSAAYSAALHYFRIVLNLVLSS